MRDFKRNNYSGKKRSFGGNRHTSGGHGFRPATMYPAVCANCGRACEVPFQPTGEKPVLCRDCFREKNGGERGHQEKNFQRPTFQQERSTPASDYKTQLDSLTRKVDKILEILTAAIAAGETSPEVTQPEEAAIPEKKKKSSKKSA